MIWPTAFRFWFPKCISSANSGHFGWFCSVETLAKRKSSCPWSCTFIVDAKELRVIHSFPFFVWKSLEQILCLTTWSDEYPPLPLPTSSQWRHHTSEHGEIGPPLSNHLSSWFLQQHPLCLSYIPQFRLMPYHVSLQSMVKFSQFHQPTCCWKIQWNPVESSDQIGGGEWSNWWRIVWRRLWQKLWTKIFFRWHFLKIHVLTVPIMCPTWQPQCVFFPIWASELKIPLF